MKGNIKGSLVVEFVDECLMSNLLRARNGSRELVRAFVDKLAKDTSNPMLNGIFGFVHWSSG
jgi:hypothetical protein